jgi:predicted outer membrane repeat protein
MPLIPSPNPLLKWRGGFVPFVTQRAPEGTSIGSLVELSSAPVSAMLTRTSRGDLQRQGSQRVSPEPRLRSLENGVLTCASRAIRYEGKHTMTIAGYLRVSHRVDLVACAATVMVLVSAGPAQAITMTVKENADCNSGATCCLRLAVDAANTPGTTHCDTEPCAAGTNPCVPPDQSSTGNNDIIQLGDTNASALTVSLGPINILKPITVQGNYDGAHADNSTVKITGSNYGIFQIGYDVDPLEFRVAYVNITGASDPDTNGSAISAPFPPSNVQAHHTVVLQTVQIDHCLGWVGGAVYVFNGVLTIDADQSTGVGSSYFHDNLAANGGAIYHFVDDGLITLDQGSHYFLHINNARFTKNYATLSGDGDGGAIYTEGDSVKLTNSLFGGASDAGNKAGCNATTCTGRGLGGAVYFGRAGADSGLHSVINTTFSYNQASASGPGGNWDGKSWPIWSNPGLSGGGAIYSNVGVILDSGNTFTSNTCTQRPGSTAQCLGGAWLADFNGYIEIYEPASFTLNSATGDGAMGGAIYTHVNVSAENVTAANTVFSDNTPASTPCNVTDDYATGSPQKNGYCSRPAYRLGYCPTGEVSSCPHFCDQAPPSQGDPSQVGECAFSW